MIQKMIPMQIVTPLKRYDAAGKEIEGKKKVERGKNITEKIKNNFFIEQVFVYELELD